MEKYQEEANYLKSLAVEAGKAIMEVYEREFDVEIKEDNSPLTEADKKSNSIIVNGLREAFPNYAILSEESKDDKSRLNNDLCFIVDPLDGTKEFIKQNGQFTVNIALCYKKRSILGVIYAPAIKKLYYAFKGEGAYLEDVESGEVKRLKVTDKTNNLIIVASKSHSSQKEKELIEEHKELISDVIYAGSSLKGCMVAEGKADVYYRFGFTSEWDTAAMHCIIEESGGIFRQLDGSEMLYNRESVLNEKGFYVVNRVENIWV